MTKTVTRGFIADGDRYRFDIALHPADGWAQIDSTQDAWYFGRWGNPRKRRLITYAEGDVITVDVDTDDEFCEELHRWAAADTWVGIDPGLDYELRDRFVALGLADLLHDSYRPKEDT